MNERMIWLLPIPILLLTALICWVLGRRTPTRRLGIGAALAMLAALACVVIGSRITALPLELGSRSWIAAFSTLPDPVARATLSLRIDGLSALFAAAALAGGTLGLLYLAQSLGASLVGYGRLWSALLLMFVGVALGVLAGDFVLLVFGWGLAILGTALARQVVGGQDQRPLTALGIAALSGLALLAAILSFALRPNDPTSGSYALMDIDASLKLATWLPLMLAIVIGLGLPPFGRMSSDDEGTPPALHGLVIACGLPLLAIYTLLRVVGLTLGAWPGSWFNVLTALGVISLLAGSVQALQTQRFGPLVGWQAVAQWGFTLLVLGQYNPANVLGDSNNQLIVITALTLALCAIWTTLTSAFALGALERRTGSDRIGGQPLLTSPLRAAGLVYALAGATAVGIPPFPGFWTRRWLHDETAASPFMLLIMVAGSGLLALSYLGPGATFWRVSQQKHSTEVLETGWANLPVLLTCGLPMVVFAVAPGLMIRAVLLPALSAIQPLVDASALLKVTDIRLITQIAAAAIVGLIMLGALRSQARLHAPLWTGGETLDRDEGTPHAPQTIGYSLRGIALLANPQVVFASIGRSLEWFSGRVAWAFQVFSGRYYLTGILIAAVTLILLLVQ
jgi:multicomponent Na+:H+ antiporter subunit D